MGDKCVISNVGSGVQRVGMWVGETVGGLYDIPNEPCGGDGDEVEGAAHTAERESLLMLTKRRGRTSVTTVFGAAPAPRGRQASKDQRC